jgi:hypothetical protein
MLRDNHIYFLPDIYVLDLLELAVPKYTADLSLTAMVPKSNVALTETKSSATEIQ